MGTREHSTNERTAQENATCDCCTPDRGEPAAAPRVEPSPFRARTARRHQRVFRVAGMDCADCARGVERQVERLPGVRSAAVNFMASKLVVEPEARGSGIDDAVVRAVRAAGYHAMPLHAGGGRPTAAGPLWRRRTLLATLASTLLWLAGFLTGIADGPPALATLLYAAAVVIGGYRIARGGIVALVRGRTLGIDLLMTIAIVGAALIGEWAEGAAVVVLFSLGAALEALTMDRARKAIRGLLDLSPREAVVRSPEGERRVPVDALVPGDVVVVRPGEHMPADGRVVQGITTVNQAPITGESLPVEKQVGDDVYAGTANERGYVEVEVTRHAHDTTLARIVGLVEEAQATRAPSQRFVDRFAAVYTPAVLLGAVLVALLPPLLGAPFLPWFYKALVLLVIACPCALVISTPVAIVAGIARASRGGVLIKGGAYLEALAGVRAIALDKTGTLTEGRPVVTDIVPLRAEASDVLALAAAVESRSEHPLAGAILRAAEHAGVGWPEIHGFEALTGRGARATVAGEVVTVGGPALFGALTPDVQDRVHALQEQGKTVLLVGRGDEVVGILAVADRVRPGAAAAVAALRAAGMAPVVMLTGDNARTAQAVARELGVDEARADLLPDDKTRAVAELLARQGRVAMVGDGVNDAPALAAATVGIAMGGGGSDTALETADIALMADDLTRLPFVLRLSRAVVGTIRANVAFSIIVKALFLLLTFAGMTNLWLAILADTGAALLVIANGMRLLRFDERRTTNDERPTTTDHGYVIRDA